MRWLWVLMNETFAIMELLQAIEALANDLPAFVGVLDPQLPHGSGVHTIKNDIRELEHIGERLGGGLFAGAEDFS